MSKPKTITREQVIQALKKAGHTSFSTAHPVGGLYYYASKDTVYCNERSESNLNFPSTYPLTRKEAKNYISVKANGEALLNILFPKVKPVPKKNTLSKTAEKFNERIQTVKKRLQNRYSEATIRHIMEVDRLLDLSDPKELGHP